MRSLTALTDIGVIGDTPTQRGSGGSLSLLDGPRRPQRNAPNGSAGRVLCDNFISMQKLLVPKFEPTLHKPLLRTSLACVEGAMVMSDAFTAAIWVGLATVALLQVLFLLHP